MFRLPVIQRRKTNQSEEGPNVFNASDASAARQHKNITCYQHERCEDSDWSSHDYHALHLHNNIFSYVYRDIFPSVIARGNVLFNGNKHVSLW